MALLRKSVITWIGVLLSSCLNGQITTAINGIQSSSQGLDFEQSKLIFENTKSLPNNTQLSIALIKNGNIDFVGVERIHDTIRTLENYRDAFEIGSITKVFTATLLAIAVTDGDLALDDPIQPYFDFEFKSDEAITFKELANHTSGLPRLPSNLNLMMVDPNNPYKEYDEAKLTDYLRSEITLNEEPGTSYQYSNLGAGILGYELAMVSNATYEGLLKKNIFETYNMRNTTSIRENLKTNLIKGLNPAGEITSNWDIDALAGAGAIISTAEDLSNFALAQFNPENKALALTHKPTFEINNTMRIGLGWHILNRKNGGELIWHNGGTGGYTSSMALDLDRKHGIIILSNVSAFNTHMRNVDQLCFGLINVLGQSPE